MTGIKVATIAGLRTLNHKSQAELADLLGITRPTMQRLESDCTNIAHRHLTKLAEMFNIPIEMIFIGNESDYRMEDYLNV
jgi:DNA-binding XRE family transcriptional regulator